MLRPAVNKITWNVDLIEIESCLNLDEYIIVWVSKEANQDSMSLNGDSVWTESNTRAQALKLEEDYENKLIEEAKAKNSKNTKK
jgi:hypothetical protein